MFKTSFLLLWRRKSSLFTHAIFIGLAWFFAVLVGGEAFLSPASGSSFSFLIHHCFWVIYLFSMAMSGDSLFKEDLSDGTLVLLKGETAKTDIFLLARFVAHFCASAFHVFVSLGIVLMLSGNFSWDLVARAFLVLPGMLALIFLMQSLCYSHQNMRLLLPLLVWPFMIPFFVFASQIAPEPYTYWILAALSCLMLPLSFWGTRLFFFLDKS